MHALTHFLLTNDEMQINDLAYFSLSFFISPQDALKVILLLLCYVSYHPFLSSNPFVFPNYIQSSDVILCLLRRCIEGTMQIPKFGKRKMHH